jgi:hypothetical protein
MKKVLAVLLLSVLVGGFVGAAELDDFLEGYKWYVHCAPLSMLARQLINESRSPPGYEAVTAYTYAVAFPSLTAKPLYWNTGLSETEFRMVINQINQIAANRNFDADAMISWFNQKNAPTARWSYLMFFDGTDNQTWFIYVVRQILSW